VAYEIAADLLRRSYAGHDGALKPWFFPALVDVTKRWLASDRVTFADDTPIGVLLLAQPKARAGEAVDHAIRTYPDTRQKRLLPVYRRFDGQGSTDEVSFLTRKVVVPVERSHLNYAVLDGGKNTWEHIVSLELNRHPDVEAFVKNDHLDFEIPYVYEGRSHRYIPDFLARLTPEPGDDVVRTLIIEVSGGQKSPGPTAVKAATARDQWCTAVNNDEKFGRWGYIEITGLEMDKVPEVLTEAFAALRADAPIIGDPAT
jgi:type III restriction enzyme